MKRELTEGEKLFVRAVAARLDATDGAILIRDLANASAESMLDDNSLILFHIEGYRRPETRGQHTYPVEGTLLDADGAVVDVLLFADPANRLFQLEFLRWADGPLQRPDWTKLKTVHVSERRKLT